MNIEDLPEFIRNKIRIIGNHWIWIGAVANENREKPQPIVKFNNKLMRASRVLFHLTNGFDLESKLQINHNPFDCNISLCISPEHLYAGTQLENMRDRDISGNNWESRKTHCPKGHEYSISPTTNYRYCQICKNQRRNEWRKMKKK